MKKFFGVFFLGLLAVLLNAATPEGWTGDFEAAKKTAKDSNKILYVLFTGSDWCPYCVQLNKNVLQKNAFQKFAKKNLVLVYLDFPRKSQADNPEQNRSLAAKYGVRGFPTAVLMKPDGAEISRISGAQPERAYLNLLQKALKTARQK